MDPISLLIQIAVSYLIGRLQQPNGPRVKDLAAGLGDYGVPLPRLFGEIVRIVGVVLAQAAIKETKHKKKPKLDYFFGVVGALLPPVITYTYSDTLALALGDRTGDDPIEGLISLVTSGKTIFRASESAIVSETLDANGRLIRRKYGKNRYCKSVTIYGGGVDQVADPILTAVIGTQPGYRLRAYVVIEDLQLKEFGNAVPVPIEALVQVKSGETVADVIETVCAAAGIHPELELSTTAAVNNLVRGCAIIDEATCWDALKPLLPAFAIEAAEVAGRIRINRRANGLRATIGSEEMGAYIFGDDPPKRFLFNRAPDKDLPKETSLTFIDPDRDYQPNTATSRRSEGSAKSNVNVNLPLVLTADEGASAAALMHWDAWLGRTQGKFTLTDAWNGIEPGKSYVIDVGGQQVPYRVTQKTRGANGILEIEALSDEAVTYTASVAGSSGTAEPPISTLIPETRIVLIDGPILNDTEDEYGFYVVTGGGDSGWFQGDVLASLTDGNYETLETSNESAAVGDVVGTLDAGTTSGLDDTLDTTSVLTVDLLHDGMTLESATDAELDAFKNLAFVGKDGLGEYLQFKTATFVSGTTWDLTDLRRGRKGTDWAITEHVSGEDFALLVDGGRFRISASTTDGWGVPLYMKGVTFNDDEADVDPILFTNTGEGKRPYSPVNVQGAWDGSHNLTITWDYRSRMNSGAPGIDDRDEYEVEILNATPDRTIIATAVESASYSAAEQTADGLVPGGTIIGRVRQTSDVNDGRWRDFVLVGPLDRISNETDAALALSSLAIGGAGVAIETDDAFALSGGPVGHRYWRINIASVNGGASTQVDEMEFRETVSGSDATGSGTAIGSGTNQSFAFDNNTANSWNPSGTSGNWIGYDFGVAKNIVEVALITSSNTTTIAVQPLDFTLEYSDDGSTWFDSGNGTMHNYGPLLSSTRAFPEAAPAAGFHRFWRLFCLDNNGGSSFIVLDDVEFHATSGSADQSAVLTADTGGSTGRSIGSSASSFKAFNASIDGSDPFFMSGTTNTYVGYIFPSPVQVQEILAQCYTNTGRAPNHAQVEYSDDGVSWTNQKSITFGTWTSNERKTVAAI